MRDVFEIQSEVIKPQMSRDMRYYGFLGGSITNVDDDQNLVRGKARIDGQGDKQETERLVPAFPGSMECKPAKGDPCIVGFIDGNPNRGFWLYQPKSTTKQRPSEPLVLGNSFGGMYNNQVTQLNTYSGTYNGHTHTYIYGTT